MKLRLKGKKDGRPMPAISPIVSLPNHPLLTRSLAGLRFLQSCDFRTYALGVRKFKLFLLKRKKKKETSTQYLKMPPPPGLGKATNTGPSLPCAFESSRRRLRVKDAPLLSCPHSPICPHNSAHHPAPRRKLPVPRGSRCWGLELWHQRQAPAAIRRPRAAVTPKHDRGKAVKLAVSTCLVS